MLDLVAGSRATGSARASSPPQVDRGGIGAGDPACTYLRRDLTKGLYPADAWPTSWPYTKPDDFKRLDEAPDTAFYKYPKLVYHIDEGAVAALTRTL